MDREQQILNAAAEIFSQKGFHAASMRDIAQAVRLQKPSLYHHVSSKQEILLALLDQGLDILIKLLGQVVSGPGSPEERLRLAMCTYLKALADHRELAAVLLLEHRSLKPELHKRHVPRRDRFENLWRELIIDGVENGNFNCADPGQATRALLGVMNWTITWYKPDGSMSAEEIADQFANLFLNGLLIRDEKHIKD